MNRTATAFLGVTMLCGLAAPALADGLTVRDLATLKRVSGHVPSPDGSRLAFVVRETDLEADRGRTDIWTLDLAQTDTAPQRLTTDPENDSQPQWSKDGSSVYFLSSRSGSSQVWRMPATGGEAVQVTDYPVDLSTFRLSPDGARIVFAADVFPDCADLQCTADRLEGMEDDNRSGMVFDKMFVRHWDTWEDDRRSALFTTDITEGAGPAIEVTGALDGDTPSVPFGGREEFTFSPDGRLLYFALREAADSEPWSTNLDIFAVPADGSEAPRNLTPDREGTDTAPQISPDGRTLAWLSMERATYESDQTELTLIDLGTGETRIVTGDWDRSPSDFAFTPDGGSVIASAGDVGTHPLFRIDLESGAVENVTAGFSASGPVIAGDRIVYSQASLAAPADLYAIALEGGEPQRLTQVNADAMAGIEMAEYEQFNFEGAESDTVHSYVMKPVGYEDGQTYPIAFLIHGGPQGSFGEGWSYRWNPQTYAAAGYGVVMVDFHGSSGYGQEFMDSINQDWGGKPLEDLQKGLKAATDRYDWLDADNACALGASYGGYMINWIAGNWPDRFKCLVNHDGLFDLRSFYFSTEELWFPEWDFGGPYWENEDVYERWNPVNHVENWQTPMLVIQGLKDYRVPPEQSLATYTALQRQGIPSRLLVFPDENHWVLKAGNSIQWHEAVLGWLDFYLSDAEQTSEDAE